MQALFRTEKVCLGQVETDMDIRYATTADAAMLSALGARTFFDTFAKDNTPENMTAYLKASFSPDIQLRELSSTENIYLIAEVENVPVGFAQLVMDSREELLKGARTMEIRRIYTAQDYIGKGVGKELMSTSIQEARQRDRDSIWLGVWEKNPRAIAFYKKWGFQEVGTHIFPVGDDLQKDLIMEMMLV